MKGMEVSLCHNFREGNALADMLAKEALLLKLDKKMQFVECSSALKKQVLKGQGLQHFLDEEASLPIIL